MCRNGAERTLKNRTLTQQSGQGLLKIARWNAFSGAATAVTPQSVGCVSGTGVTERRCARWASVGLTRWSLRRLGSWWIDTNQCCSRLARSNLWWQVGIYCHRITNGSCRKFWPNLFLALWVKGLSCCCAEVSTSYICASGNYPRKPAG